MGPGFDGAGILGAGILPPFGRGGRGASRTRINHMKRALVIAALLALLAGGTVRAAGAGAARPNILFILVDDLRWDALGCTGHPFSRTPNIDRLAQEGALFRNAFVT